jgi:hypothetical protein
MGSVADPGRFIPDPGILIFIHPGSWISDTGSNNTNKRGGRKKNLLSYVFLQTKALKNMGWDQGSETPGFGNKLFRVPDQGVKRQRIVD